MGPFSPTSLGFAGRFLLRFAGSEVGSALPLERLRFSSHGKMPRLLWCSFNTSSVVLNIHVS